MCSVLLELSDRLLLYSGGVTETQNAAGEEFGDQQLERVVRSHRLQPASELLRQVLSELERLRPAAMNQQDDITLIIAAATPNDTPTVAAFFKSLIIVSGLF